MITRNIKQKLAACIVCCGLAVTITSCDDIVNYNEGYTPAEQLSNTGAPVIRAVYDVADTARLTPITEGALNQMVVLVGDNLNQPSRISFNTVECNLSDVYTQKSQAIVRIPSTLSMEHVNKIEYTTSQGIATYDFVIPFPKLTVSRLENEFARVGSQITIYGQNFNLYGFDSGASTVSVAGTTVVPSEITSTSMLLAIPEGTPDDSHIQFSWQDQEGTAMTASLPFRPVSKLLYGDFSDTQVSIDGSVSVIVEEQNGMKGLHFTGSYGAWAWNTIDLSRNMVATVPDGSPVENLSLKFELLTQPNFPLTEDTGLQFAFNWGDSYAWNPADGQGINTRGEWQTITLPLAPMATKGIKQAGEWQTLRIVFQPHAAYEADFCLSNFRIVEQ